MKKLAKGFTLIELMIVVAIIGILAAIAIPNFVKYQLRSKFGEGTTNLEGLRKAEEALRQGERKITIDGTLVASYRSGQYWDLGGGAVTPPLPAVNGTTVGTDKITWDATEIQVAQAVDWQVEGSTYFKYIVSIAPCADTTFANAGLCYFAAAYSDIDGDGVNGEVGLSRPTLDMATVPDVPTGIVTAWPATGTGGSCVDNSDNPVYAMPCTLTGPDVF